MSETSRWTKSRKHGKKFSKRIKENNEVLNKAKIYEQNKQQSETSGFESVVG